METTPGDNTTYYTKYERPYLLPISAFVEKKKLATWRASFQKGGWLGSLLFCLGDLCGWKHLQTRRKIQNKVTWGSSNPCYFPCAFPHHPMGRKGDNHNHRPPFRIFPPFHFLLSSPLCLDDNHAADKVAICFQTLRDVVGWHHAAAAAAKCPTFFSKCLPSFYETPPFLKKKTSPWKRWKDSPNAFRAERSLS